MPFASRFRMALLALAALALPALLTGAVAPTATEPAAPPQSGSLTGQLLIASPDMRDPRFDHAVIVVVRHDRAGALGLVINMPAGERPLAELLAAIGEKGESDAKVPVFVGGPVQPEAAIGLARGDHGAEPDGFAPLFDGLGTVDLERAPDEVVPRVERLRVFAGYAGWGPRQLEAELDAGGWFVVRAERADPWSASPEGMWRAVLRRQHGKARLFADFPVDARLN